MGWNAANEATLMIPPRATLQHASADAVHEADERGDVQIHRADIRHQRAGQERADRVHAWPIPFEAPVISAVVPANEYMRRAFPGRPPRPCGRSILMRNHRR